MGCGAAMTTSYLVGDRIKLVKFSERHITPKYMDWVNEQENNRYMVRRIPCSRDEIKIPNPQEMLLFAVMTNVPWCNDEKSNDYEYYIGTATIHNLDWINHKGEVGYMIGSKDHWGRGLATEIVGLLCNYAFSLLGFNKLTAEVVSENKASVRVLEKNGFKLFGTNPEDYFLDGKYLDNLLYVKLRNMYVS